MNGTAPVFRARRGRGAARPCRCSYECRGRGRRDEHGSAAIELILMTPLLVAFIVMVIGAGRLVESRSQVNDTAYAAARAASLAPNLDAARQAGQRAAADALSDRGKACARLDVSLAGTVFEAGGHVKVEVTCTADLHDVVGFGLPGTKSFTATAVVPIEKYRDLP